MGTKCGLLNTGKMKPLENQKARSCSRRAGPTGPPDERCLHPVLGTPEDKTEAAPDASRSSAVGPCFCR